AKMLVALHVPLLVGRERKNADFDIDDLHRGSARMEGSIASAGYAKHGHPSILQTPNFALRNRAGEVSAAAALRIRFRPAAQEARACVTHRSSGSQRPTASPRPWSSPARFRVAP